MWENGRMKKVRRSHKQVMDQTTPPSADDEAKLEGARTMTSAAAGGKNLREGPEWQEGISISTRNWENQVKGNLLISFPVNIARAGGGTEPEHEPEPSRRQSTRNGKHKQLWQAIKVMLRNAAGISMRCSWALRCPRGDHYIVSLPMCPLLPPQGAKLYCLSTS